MTSGKFFRIALFVSALAHVAVLYQITLDDPLAPESEAPATLQITLEKVFQEPEVREPEPAHPEEPKTEEPLPPEVPDEPEDALIAEAPPPPVTETVEEQTPKQHPVLRQPVSSIISTIVEQDRDAAFKAALVPGCSNSEHASRVRICKQRETIGADPYEITGTFSQAFAALSESGPDFKKDMARVETLLQRQEELDGLAESAEGMEAAFIAAERREIHDEIMRIDRRHSQVNLLKLIPVGYKTVKRLWEEVQRRKG